MAGRPRAPHGTRAAYKRHISEKTRVCDACEAWRTSEKRPANLAETIKVSMTAPPAVETIEKTPEAPKRDLKERLRSIDPIEETLDNLDAIKDAITWARLNDPGRLGPLSKRKSELIQELVALGAINPEEPSKLEGLLDAPAGGETSDNVTQLGFRKASA